MLSVSRIFRCLPLSKASLSLTAQGIRLVIIYDLQTAVAIMEYKQIMQ